MALAPAFAVHGAEGAPGPADRAARHGLAAPPSGGVETVLAMSGPAVPVAALLVVGVRRGGARHRVVGPIAGAAPAHSIRRVAPSAPTAGPMPGAVSGVPLQGPAALRALLAPKRAGSVGRGEVVLARLAGFAPSIPAAPSAPVPTPAR